MKLQHWWRSLVPTTSRTCSPHALEELDTLAGQGFTVRDFSWDGRLHSYRLFVPAVSVHRRLPMVVMLHGCKQDAAGGIGRALSRQLHAQGLRVAAVGRDANRLADVEAHARIVADTTTPDGAAQVVSNCQDVLGAPPALLAHCVGSTLITPLHRTQAQAYRE